MLVEEEERSGDLWKRAQVTKSACEGPMSKRRFRRTSGMKKVPEMLSGTGCRRGDRRSCKAEVLSVAGAVAELGEGSGVLLGSARCILDGEGAAVLCRARRGSQL